VWSWNTANALAYSASRDRMPHYDAGTRLFEHFFNAGLRQPTMFCEVLIGGGEDSPLYAWMADTVHSFGPQLVRMGLVGDEATVAATLEERLRTAVSETYSQIEGPAQMCAWVRV
jgi:hypothetical protein